MTVAWETAGDFASVVDGLRPVILRRRGGGSETPIPGALRSPSTETEAEPSGGFAIAKDATWSFVTPDGVDPPRIGDALIDGDGGCWTLLEVQAPRLSGPTHCRARDLAIHHGLEGLVTIQQSILQDNGSGPEIVGWATVRPAAPARIQPVEVRVDQQAVLPVATSRFKVMIVDDLQLNHRHRLVDARGVVYKIDRYLQPERIDALAIIEASIVETASV